MMPKSRRFWIVMGVVALLLVVALLGFWLAIRHEPAFYRRALETDRAVLAKGSDRMLQKMTSLQNAFNAPGRWSVVITADEINGWLAVDLAKNHPNTLPKGMSDPRVAISANDITAGCRYEAAGVNAVVSLTIRASMPEPNVVALQIVRARAGAIPAPLKGVLDGLSRAAQDMRLRLDWHRSGGDPVAMLSIPDDPDADCVVRIEHIGLAEDEIQLSGTTERKRR